MTFKPDTHETPVIFRRFPDGDVIALFPTLPAHASGYSVESYMHVGQHSAADLDLINRTKPAKPAEYADLARELEAAPYGYRLKTYQKHTAGHRDAFRAAQRRA